MPRYQIRKNTNGYKPEVYDVTTTDPYEILSDLMATIGKLNISDNTRQLVDEGYTVIQIEDLI